ncbi:MAG: hypothetical protein ACRC5T_11185 [Cetobacterium sp.]
MARTLLQLVQQAANEIGLPEPLFLFGNQNDQEKQLIALAIREGKDFSSVANKNGGWQNLRKDYSFSTEILNTAGDTTVNSAIVNIPDTTGLDATWQVSGNGFPEYTMIVSVDSATQITVSNACNATQVGIGLNFGKIAYDIPSDFEYFVQRTFWDDRFKWELLGPITAQEKQVLRYGVIASGPRNKFYIRQDKMWLDPMPTSVNLIAYDYYSNHWCESSIGTTQKYWQTDADTYKLDEDCFIQGIKWRFLRAKGLDYSAEYQQYIDDVNKVIARDGGSRDLPLGGAGFRVNFLNSNNIPDAGYGQ